MELEETRTEAHQRFVQQVKHILYLILSILPDGTSVVPAFPVAG